MDTDFKVPMGFAQRRLPWIVAAAMLVVFVFTMGNGANPGSLAALSRVAGWDWRPAFAAPVHYLVTWPIGWLPAGLQLFALNLLAAVFGALTLWLLARSVSLLPHDRTKEQRQLERSDYSLLSIPAAWLPPLLAALVCGLQLTFWENSIAASGEMLDLLLFAYLIRCLLEYRLDERERWLTKFSFVYGLAVTNNYAMLGFFPAFLVAMVWIKGVTFFKWRFIVRMVLAGTAGLLLYLLLPIVATITSAGDYQFWDMLRSYWGMQKSALGGAVGARFLMIFLCLTSLLPILFIGIRWPASLGDTSPTGQALTNLTTHIIHLVFFAACLYVTLDLHFSPRGLTAGRFALLPFYYLGALAIGYFAGYFLLVFGSKPDPNAKSWQRPSLLRQVLNIVLVAAVWLVLVAVPGALAWRNYPKIRAASGPALSRLSATAAASLPTANTAVIADDAVRLLALADELRRRSPGHGHILIESSALQFPAYHRHMSRRHGERWPKVSAEVLRTGVVDAYRVVETLDALRRAGGLHYLHPSFGYFFERFHLKPAKALYVLEPYPDGAVSAPPLTAAEIQAQDAWWKQLKAAEFGPLLAAFKPMPAPAAGSKTTQPEELSLSTYVAHLYSRAINHFGVEVQRAGDFKLAGEYFDLARQLNHQNLWAALNQEYNRNLQAGNRASIQPSEATLQRIKQIGSSDALLNIFGPPDEPSVCYYVGENFSRTGHFRQSAQALERTIFFNPTNITARLLHIAQVLQIGARGMADRAMELITDLRARPPVPLTLEDQLDLLRAEAFAWVYKTNLPAAERLLLEAQAKHPAEILPFFTQVQIYESVGFPEKSIETLERQLKVQPENPVALVNISAFHIRAGRFADALPFLERALKIKPKDPTALINRAVANLNLAQQATGQPALNRLDLALADYRELEATQPKNHFVVYGLAQCYRLKGNREAALRYFRKYLEDAPRGTPEARLVEQTIATLKAGSQ